MAIRIDRLKAEKMLSNSLLAKEFNEDENTKIIKLIIEGNHKTYKYVLVTGLLAKALNNNVNPLALQAGAPINGAYDARSLCHSVVVPFERDFLYNALGGSNEPFLNKPARFTHLSENNAVRRGKDKEKLLSLIQLFSHMDSSDDANIYLDYAISLLLKIANSRDKNKESMRAFNPTLNEISQFIIEFTEKSYEGETCAIIVGTLERLFYKKFDNGYKVITHKVNQSGESSKEVGDIDIYYKSNFVYAIEVKDKDFSKYDVDHAFNKIMKEDGAKGMFIYGPKAQFDSCEILEISNEYEDKGFFHVIQSVNTYSRDILLRLDIESCNEFIHELQLVSKEINAKIDTTNWIKKTVKSMRWHHKGSDK